MLRGVWVFLIFIMAVCGWGMYFYQSALKMEYKSGSLHQATTPSVSVPDTVRVAKEKDQKVKQLKKAQEKIKNILSEKRQLEQKYSDLLSRVEKIESTYKGIIKENMELKNKLSKSEYRLGVIESDLNRQKDTNTKLLMKVQSLQGELKAVRLENKVLKAKVRELNSTLTSLPKLKRVMHDLKLRIYFERKQKQREHDKIALEKGNKGYVVFNGKPTIGHSVSVEVLPAFD